MLDESGEAAVGVDDWSVLWDGEPSLGQWRLLRRWWSSSSSAGRGIPSSWLRDRASNQSSSFWKGGLGEEEGEERNREGTHRGLRLKPDWQGWAKTWGSNLGRSRSESSCFFPHCFYRDRITGCLSRWRRTHFSYGHYSQRFLYIFATQLLHISWFCLVQVIKKQ